ncbi:ABC transporter ATP-binding protein [Streptomyces sp. NBC_01795]|uniref:ABC transporter ATP-binding protein n=1 Tax=Streptomyces sp. NBC_01795 TaxID=2975943 RepID=UPI002DD81011|nr:ABC transporter ATP-binding protein [Streptomyces sp. NBC_01795]WSA93989.1 ABC transporter ATP-binding protein [Streptomyces sp. NBC_01795]
MSTSDTHGLAGGTHSLAKDGDADTVAGAVTGAVAGAGGAGRLAARGLTLAYEDRTVVEHLDLDIPDGQVTVVVGPNACGKSTTLRALGRLLKPRAGAVLVDGEELARLPTRKIAQSIGLLPQSPVAPEAITVSDLVSRGRQPHQRWWQQWSREDERAVTDAMERTDVTALGDRPVDELSGGQRQRVWIAMALAQETDLLLLDEPTTYLDIAHQVEVLDLVRQLASSTGDPSRVEASSGDAATGDASSGDASTGDASTGEGARGRTVVMVLHDLNQAARYADHLVAMKEGRLVAQGPPGDIVNAELVREVFGLESVVVPCPVTGDPLVVPGAPWQPGVGVADVPAPRGATAESGRATTESGGASAGKGGASTEKGEASEGRGGA